MGETLQLASPDKPTNPRKEESFTQDREKSLVDNLRDEILSYYQTMKQFNDMDPTEVFGSLSAFSARASEIRTYVNQSDSKRSQALRVKVIDPFIEECDRQFKIHSRIVAIQESEIRMSGGRYT